MPLPDGYGQPLDPRATDTLRSAMLGAGYSPSAPQSRNTFDQFDEPTSAKAAFDPDAYLAAKPAAFDPDAYFATKSPAESVTWDAPAKPMSWSDVGSQALQNAPASAVQFGRDIVQPIIHPIDTISNIGDVGHGLAQKLGLSFGPDNPEDTAKADAVGQFFKNRYGSVEGFKHALANDPVGVAGDLSMLLTGGETALARAPGIAGRVGEMAGAAGRAIDPVSNAARAGKLAGRGAGYVGSEALGLTTGVGGEPIRLAARSGLEGGQGAEAFRQNMRGAASFDDVVNDARNAVGQMRQERGQAYRDSMAKIGADNTIMSWNDVDTALADMNRVATYKGQSLSPSTEAMRNKITATIDDWKNLKASEYWTPEGFDALKKKIGDLRDASERGTPERLVADQAYNAIKKTIVDQAPAYGRAMKGYQEASDLIKEMEKTLSINPKASVDTTLRKLQSVLRDNVTTAYGRRAELADYLVNAGAPQLMEKLAGQSLGAWMPRGWGRLVATEIPAMAAGAIGAGTAGAGVGALATLPAMSPRLVGEVAHGAGRGARRFAPMATPLSALPRPARQIGRLPANQQFDPDAYLSSQPAASQ